MKDLSYHILRIGMGVTFIWIGVMILRDPLTWWQGYVLPWAQGLAVLPGEQLMVATGLFDVGIGLLILTDILTFYAALIGALHILGVLIVSGINSVTIRDIGLLASSLAIMVQTFKDEE